MITVGKPDYLRGLQMHITTGAEGIDKEYGKGVGIAGGCRSCTEEPTGK